MTLQVPISKPSYACSSRLRVGAPSPSCLLEHLLVLVLAHLLAPLLDYRAQTASKACVSSRRGSRRRIIPYAAPWTFRPTLSLNGPDVLHGRPRRAPPPHPEVPRRRGPAAPRRVGG